MAHTLVISSRAQQDMQEAARWWADNRSAVQANRWLAELDRQLQAIGQSPERNSPSPEDGQVPYPLREIHFGLGRRPTHRAVFTVVGDLVIVLAVRHLAQDSLKPGDLP
jgi:plasmid stabilization system protein ParE